MYSVERDKGMHVGVLQPRAMVVAAAAVAVAAAAAAISAAVAAVTAARAVFCSSLATLQLDTFSLCKSISLDNFSHIDNKGIENDGWRLWFDVIFPIPNLCLQ